MEVHARDLVHDSNYDLVVFLIVVFDAFSFVVGTPHIFDSVELTDLSPESHTAGFSPRTKSKWYMRYGLKRRWQR